MFLTKLRRMMTELPQEFMEPVYKESPPPPEAKLVGQLTEEERRLFGVLRQLQNKINLDDDAHQVLHNARNHNEEDCLNHQIRQYRCEFLLYCVNDILTLSLRERLSLPESMFDFDGNDIYAFPDDVVSGMRLSFEMIKKTGNLGQGPDSYMDEEASSRSGPPFDPFEIDPKDPKKMN